jgi:hypothetical protein
MVKNLRKFLFFAFAGLFLMWAGFRIYHGVMYELECSGHLKRAADANTVETAKEELKVVLDYLESHNMTEGNTGVIIQRPSQDVGFWYNNIKSSYDELCELPEDATGLERSNMLIKLRETLIDHDGDSGDSVTEPSNIAVFPNNAAYLIWFWFSFIMTVIFGVSWIRHGDYF